MATNKEILFSARDNGVENTMSRLKRSAKELSDGILRESAASSSSQRDIIRNYEDQIRLIGRRNEIDAEGRRLEADSRLNRIMSDPKSTDSQRSKAQDTHAEALKQISLDKKSDDMQVRLLKEIADTLKLDIRTDSEGRLRDSEGNEIKPGQRARDRGKSRTPLVGSNQDVAGFVMSMQGVLGSSSMESMLMNSGGTLASMGGRLGQVGKVAQVVGAVGEMMNMINDAKASVQQSAMLYSGLSGISAENIDKLNIGDGAYQFGYSRSQYLEQILPQAAQARGSVSKGLNSAWRVGRNTRGTGLDQATMLLLERISGRQLEGGQGMTSTDLISRLVSKEGGYGSGREMDFSKLGDAIQGLTSLQQTMFSRSGSLTNLDNALQMSGNLKTLGGAYGDDQNRWTTVQNLDRGLSSQGSPEAKRLKLSILRQQMPGASLAELNEELEKGLSSEHLARGVFGLMNKSGGSDNSRAFLLQALLGGDQRWSDINAMSKSENYEQMMSVVTPESPSEVKDEISRRAGGAVSGAVEDKIHRPEYTEDFKANTIGGVLNDSRQILRDILGATDETKRITNDYFYETKSFYEKLATWMGL